MKYSGFMHQYELKNLNTFDILSTAIINTRWSVNGSFLSWFQSPFDTTLVFDSFLAFSTKLWEYLRPYHKIYSQNLLS